MVMVDFTCSQVSPSFWLCDHIVVCCVTKCILCHQKIYYIHFECVWVRSTKLTTRGLNTNIHQLHRFTNFVLALIQSNSVLSKTAALYRTFALNYDSCNLFVSNDWNVYVHIKINIGLNVSHTYNYIHTEKKRQIIWSAYENISVVSA